MHVSTGILVHLSASEWVRRSARQMIVRVWLQKIADMIDTLFFKAKERKSTSVDLRYTTSTTSPLYHTVYIHSTFWNPSRASLHGPESAPFPFVYTGVGTLLSSASLVPFSGGGRGKDGSGM
jgi:hypothetical protein